jgi:hypothetical protein
MPMWFDKFGEAASYQKAKRQPVTDEQPHRDKKKSSAMEDFRERMSGLWIKDGAVHRAAVKWLNAHNAAFWKQHEWTEEPSKKVNPSLAELNRRHRAFWGGG